MELGQFHTRNFIARQLKSHAFSLYSFAHANVTNIVHAKIVFHIAF